jgi:TPR repeat protein
MDSELIEARQWLSKAAWSGVKTRGKMTLEIVDGLENGCTAASANIAQLYFGNDHIKQHPAKAFFFAKRSAYEGDPHGMHVLANCYEEGVGCDVDYSAAFKWQLKAADNANGNLPCMKKMASYWRREKIEKEAVKWDELMMSEEVETTFTYKVQL